MRELHGIINSMDMSFSKLWEVLKDGEAWHAVVRVVTKSWTQLSDYTTTTCAHTQKIIITYMGLP